MNNVAIVRHRVDLDGTFSALVVDYYLKKNHNIVPTHIGFNYGDNIPELGEYDVIFMVDISFPPNMMKKLSDDPRKIIWIDHHFSAIENSKKYGYEDMEGLRYIGDAACEICWNYLFKAEAPQVIKVLSAYDTWQKEKFNWRDIVLPIQLALKTKYGLAPQSYTTGIFERLIDENDELLNKMIEVGKIIFEYDQRRFKSAINAYSFEVTVAKKYKAICTLCTDFGSNLYTSVINDYEIFLCCNRRTDQNGKTIFILSFYSEPGKCDLNLASYAELWGGGGHRCASSCTISQEDFMKLLTERVI